MSQRRAGDGPDPVDLHVGRRLRLRRVLLGLSQQRLADCIGLSFQQVQKYEKGTNRLSASRLYDFAQHLEVPIAYFFDDLPPEKSDRPEVEGIRSPSSGSSVQGPAFELKRETLELVRAYYRIRPRHLRNRLLDLIKKLADAEARAPAAAAQTAVTAQRR